MRVSGEMRLITWTFAKMLGKKRYEVATVEKKMEMNESSLKLRESIPMRSAFARKKKMIGMSGRRMSERGPEVEGEPGADRHHADEVREHLADDDRRRLYRESRGGSRPLRSIRSFMMLIMKNWEVK